MSGPRWEPAPQPGSPWSSPGGPATPPTPPTPPSADAPPTQAVPVAEPVPPTEPVPAVPSWASPSSPSPASPPLPPGPGGPPVDPPAGGDGGSTAPSDPRSTARRRLVITASALGVVALLLVGILVVAGRGDDDASPTTTTSLPGRTTTSLEVLSGDVDLGSGVIARVPAGSLTAGATLRAEPVAFPADRVGPAIGAAGPFLGIRVVGGEQLGPIELVFPIDDPGAATPPGATEPILFAVHARPGGVETVAGTYDAAAKTFAVQARSLATWGPARWSWERVDESLAAATAAYHDAGSLDLVAPSCSGPDRADVVTVDDPDGVLRWCAEGQLDGERTVRLVNAARHAVLLEVPEGVAAEVGPAPGTSQELARWIDEGVGAGRHVLGPGQAAVLAVSPDAAAEVTASYGGVAHQVTSLRAGIDAVLALRSTVPFAAGGDAVAVERSIDPTACFGEAHVDDRVDLGVAGAVVGRCIDGAVLEGAVGPALAPALGPLLRTEAMADALASRVQEGVDRTGDDATIRVEPVPERPSPDDLWPTGDLEGTPEYAAWLAVSLTLPDWTSCGGGICLAGTGGSVLVTSLDPLEDLGTVPFDVDDPLAALVELGVAASDARKALAPG